MGHKQRDFVSSATHEDSEVTQDADRKTIDAVLNSYAHGATTEQSAKSAGVDYSTAYKIIAEAIAAQESPE